MQSCWKPAQVVAIPESPAGTPATPAVELESRRCKECARRPPPETRCTPGHSSWWRPSPTVRSIAPRLRLHAYEHWRRLKSAGGQAQNGLSRSPTQPAIDEESARAAASPPFQSPCVAGLWPFSMVYDRLSFAQPPAVKCDWFEFALGLPVMDLTPAPDRGGPPSGRPSCRSSGGTLSPAVA